MSGDNSIYAHSLPKPFNFSDWELLETHHSHVSMRAEHFATVFGAAAWGRLAGAWHDLGKCQLEFQEYIRGLRAQGPSHAWVGALLAVTLSKQLIPVAFAIAGHHCGLADLSRDSTIEFSGGPVPLRELVEQRKIEFSLLKPLLSVKLADDANIELPAFITERAAIGSARFDMFIRFLFSVLVDADRVATANFYGRHIPALTADHLRYDGVSSLRLRLDRFIGNLTPKGSPAVIALRGHVLETCRKSSEDAPGRFSLTVPTGGGKTLSAMSFAMRHAERHGLRRVIVVIPYTSIIEQSARVYRGALNDPTTPGVNNVLEHHSNLDEQALHESDSRGEQLRKLAAENWDAPVVVTTTVQFFESLLSNDPSQCRKLHNIAKSVVLLDEVQTLPPQFLRTVLDVLNQLTDHYGCSVVLTTATPPALAKNISIARPGLMTREIMQDPSALAAQARRVVIEWRTDQVVTYQSLADEIRLLRQVLVIVHRRDDARQLVELVGNGALHLSAAMCPAHRLTVY